MNELLHWRDFQHHAHATRLSDAHGTRKPLARTNSRACLEFFCSSMSEIASPPSTHGLQLELQTRRPERLFQLALAVLAVGHPVEAHEVGPKG